MERPIDKTKKANRRCINCAHWRTRKVLNEYSGESQCLNSDIAPTPKVINYWNCCRCFTWSPDKQYVQSEN